MNEVIVLTMLHEIYMVLPFPPNFLTIHNSDVHIKQLLYLFIKDDKTKSYNLHAKNLRLKEGNYVVKTDDAS